MWDKILPAIISGGSSLLGGFLNKGAQSDANETNMAINDRNIALQREFAQNALQWKAADAEKAGIHPVFAMGASGPSFSPVTLGASAETGVGTGLAGMGQDISRAVSAYRPPGEKVGGAVLAQQQASNALDLETKTLNNQLLRAKLADMTQPGNPPGVPFDVPENPKLEQNPKLMISGSRWDTDKTTSPMKAWEDRYGDEGPVAWGMPLAIGARDLERNYGNPATWPGKMAQWAANYVWEDMKNEGSNAKRWLQGPGGGSVSPRSARPRGYY